MFPKFLPLLPRASLSPVQSFKLTRILSPFLWQTWHLAKQEEKGAGRHRRWVGRGPSWASPTALSELLILHGSPLQGENLSHFASVLLCFAPRVSSASRGALAHAQPLSCWEAVSTILWGKKEALFLTPGWRDTHRSGDATLPGAPGSVAPHSPLRPQTVLLLATRGRHTCRGSKCVLSSAPLFK